MTPIDVTAAIVTVLTTAFPAWTVEAHGGTFTERELPLLLAKVPCILLSVQGFPQFLPHGPQRWSAELDLAVTIFSRDEPDVSRAEQALEAAFTLLTLLPGQRWGLDAAKPPVADSLRADNLYSGYVNNLRVALWSVAWKQPFILEPPSP